MTAGPPRVVIIVENLSVPFDRRVWQEARALVDAGYRVRVIAPRGSTRDRAPFEVLDGVELSRYELRGASGSLVSYVREYLTAIISTRRLLRAYRRENGWPDIIQLCNPPDLLFLAILGYRRHGCRVIFDHHDLGPELAVSRFGRKGQALQAPLRWMERATFTVADHVLATNASYADIAGSRGKKKADQVTIVRSAPARTMVVDGSAAHRAVMSGGPHLLCYIGVMGPQDGVDFALRAIAHLRDVLGRDDVRAVFIGDGDARAACEQLAAELGLLSDGTVTFVGRLPDREVMDYFASATVCLAPDPLNPLNDLSSMNKVIEYMAAGVPIVAFRLKETAYTAGDAALYAEPNDTQDFAQQIARLLDDPALRAQMRSAGLDRSRELSWDESRRALLNAYDRVGRLPQRRGRWKLNGRTGRRRSE